MLKQRKCKWCGEWMYFRPCDRWRDYCCKECSENHHAYEYNEEGNGPVMHPLDASKVTDEGYLALMKAIVGRASDDVTQFKPETRIHQEAVEFFKSEHFHNLTGLDGKAILRDLLKNCGKTKTEIRAERKVYKSRYRRVRCLENDMVYDSIKEAAEVFGCSSGCIHNVCAGKQQSTRGLHFEYAKGE